MNAKRARLRDEIAEVIRLAMIDQDATYDQIAEEVLQLLERHGLVTE